MLPRAIEPNQKQESSFHRSRSYINSSRAEAMNELEGIERQDVKIQKYSRSNMKNHKLANGKLCRTPGSPLNPTSMPQRVAEKEGQIDDLAQRYAVLEQRLIAQTELIQHCKKVVQEEWESRKPHLLQLLASTYLPQLDTILQERVLVAVLTRKPDIDQCILDKIKAKFLLPS